VLVLLLVVVLVPLSFLPAVYQHQEEQQRQLCRLGSRLQQQQHSGRMVTVVCLWSLPV
jgi:Tfp pilus assembly protein PilN